MTIRVLACGSSLEAGGSERQLVQLVRVLPAEHFLREIYLLHRRGTLMERVPAGVPIHDFFSHYHARLWWPGRIRRAQIAHMTEILRRRAIDVVYDRTYHMTLVTGAACRRLAIPRISVITSPPSRDFGQARERFHRWKRYLLARYYQSPQSVIIAVSRAVAEDAAEYFRLPLDRITVVPNAVDAEAIERAAQQQWSAPDAECRGRPYWLMVARMTAEKGHQRALEAFAAYRRMIPAAEGEQLLLVGDGPLRAQLQALCQQLQLDSCVRFCGAVNNPFPLMRRAVGLLIPSQYEGLPNVALEAMVLGRPVIATPCSDDLVTLLSDGRGWVSNAMSAEAVCNAMRQLRTADAAVVQERANRGREYVLQHHGLLRWGGTMQQLIAALVESAGPTNPTRWRKTVQR
ncbi:MAG: hypothetical protein KatS3mg111_3716 [Pirellulaceae bacterium]|nr:MAG: hypothetical protein KatS3mg111_3716 [Pirellulaceae bacterium]